MTRETMTNEQLDQLSINTIRTLSMDAVQKANSGHPGTPMALAPLVYTIWNRVMRFDPQDPIWPNRDRFVLSNGHADTGGNALTKRSTRGFHTRDPMVFGVAGCLATELAEVTDVVE